MPIYNFGNGINGVYTYNNGIYSYSNGNLTTNMAVVNGMPYMQNIMMLNGTGSGCGETTCSQGYSLYFPCLKNITRGEDVCFDFYVVDNASKDVVDLRKVDALTITLGGAFGCTLGTYSYPSDDNYIRPLQSQEYKSVMNEGFKERPSRYLTVSIVNTNFDEIDEKGVEGNVGEYFDGEIVELEAFDTDSYIFVGWVDIDAENDVECDDYFYSTERSISFEIHRDMNLAAVFRKRRKFKINVYERNSFFSYFRNGEEKPLHNGHIVEEGKHILVRSLPFNCIFLDWNASDFGDSTHTRTDMIVIEIEVKSDISLKINNMDIQEGENIVSENSNDEQVSLFDLNFIGFSFRDIINECGIEPHNDVFETHQLSENEPNRELVFIKNADISSLFENSKPVDFERLYCYYMGNNCILRFGDKEGNGYVDLPNPGIEEETIVEIYANKYNSMVESSISIELDDNESQIQEIINDGINKLTFSFENTDFQKMRISSFGEIFPEEKPSQCLIDRIDISDLVIIDKGKATLCLPGSITAKFHRGKITATGAIMVSGSTHGLPCAMVGTVNGNPIINVI